MSGRRVLVCGGRHYLDVPRLWRVLDGLHAERRISAVIEGASDDVTGPYIGADYWAHQWACAHDVTTIRQHAKWQSLGRAAGPIRNRQMLAEHKPDLIVAFPGNVGTANMIAQARAAGIAVIEVSDNGASSR